MTESNLFISLKLPIETLKKWRETQTTEMNRLKVCIEHYDRVIDTLLTKIHEVKKDLDALSKAIEVLEKSEKEEKK